MRPHAEDFDGSLFFVHFIDKTVLNVDAVGIIARQNPDQLFVARRDLERVFGYHVEQLFHSIIQPSLFEQLLIFAPAWQKLLCT